MYAVLENNPAARSDCTILSLSWKGTVPDSEKDKSYTRKRCYTEGWLATGNVKGIVGVTYTCSHARKNAATPSRTNFNLRGHNSEVVLVRWNEPFQKMATCDAQGVIFVWIKYEGRWSIELVNDRSCQVSDFAWSHDGRMALICYKDGFVLVGSVTGQRYWSSMLNLEAKLLCGAWAPDDKQVLLGTSDGQILVMDIHGAIVTQCTLAEDRPIKALLWSSEKFRMINVSDNESDEKPDKKKRKGSERRSRLCKKRCPVMAVDLGDSEIQLMKAYDDLTPISIKTEMTDIKMEWSSCGAFLAVGGAQPVESISAIKFYNTNGHLRFTLNIPSQRPLSALTWGHNDRRLFVACGAILHVAWVEKGVAPLQVLCREVITALVSEEKATAKLPLPGRLRTYTTDRLSLTVKGCIPDPTKLREFGSRPPPGNERLHCTMIRTGDDTNPSSSCYTLFLEYLGGLVPLLKGRRVSKLRPEFVIYDPKVSLDQKQVPGEEDERLPLATTIISSSSSSSSEDSEDETLARMIRRNGTSSGSPRLNAETSNGADLPRRKERQYNSLFLDSLPEQNRLVEVTSNIWGTKFKLHGLARFLPANLGQVHYRTSLLHLQPRQMTIALVELRPDAKPRRDDDEDADFDPNVFSEDEDEPGEPPPQPPMNRAGGPAPIAPMKSTNRSFSSSDLDVADQEPPPPAMEVSQPLEVTNENISSTSKVQPDREQFIRQGAIPKRRTSNLLKTSLEATTTVAGRTGALDVVENAQIINGTTEIVDGTLISSEPCDFDELQTDMPRWADSASQLIPAGVAQHHAPTDGGIANQSVDHKPLPMEVQEGVVVAVPSGRKRDVPLQAEKEPSVQSQRSLKPRENRPRSSSSPKSIMQMDTRTNSGSPQNGCGRDSSPSGSGKSPQEKRKRPKSKTRSRSESSAGTSPGGSGAVKQSDSEIGPEPEKAKKASKDRRTSLCGGGSPSWSRMKSHAGAVDSSESDADNANSSEETPAAGGGSAKSRRAKLMRQYADCKSKVFVMRNKAPLWNESTQVYQLDFGGRVTQESAKNFQVELHGKQVMQFGRIDGHAYTLDFQYPFAALQAFAVALANVTQRLK
ncbi:tubby-related protein 4-like [Acanthaster planci]|uniref:Tubby-related protein 4-like n=1 Tax=Acanthaster planci TaxID=133434 RepID=A0A8B7XNS5_ACAPL|nr:tubby-related protein 4-like [Acanthaster planci]XP_022081828.1 tubby-related protein 4-like [Acanthaster planci]XP_022081829.1 tubby-related protein 4-like [Acanthaster planci]XP_022081830.1 tubby-related protein 4-like [Acanthaster planci]XP_022081831.1 tubby-related protein 4-like [Acanthaster planci]